MYLIRKINILAPFILVLALTGCGGGSETVDTQPVDTAPYATVSGKVIDGYVAGATVFLDLNFNSLLDTNEPKATSTEKGSYELELNEEQRQCLGYVPVVVDVPVGAIDEDLGEVTEAYQMILPPSFLPISDEDLLHISPLTTVVWTAIESILTDDTISLSCDSIIADQSKRETLTVSLESAVRDVVTHYNIAEDKIYADFIAEGDDESKVVAMNIVKGLKKSLKETAKLKAENPDATWAKINYHMSDYRDADDMYPNAWYRAYQLNLDNKSVFKLTKVSDDLATEVRPIIYGERTNIYNGSSEFYESYELESRNGDDSDYTCDIKEGVANTANDVSNELTNLVSKSATVFEDCLINNFASEATMRYAHISYQEDEVEHSAQFIISPDGNGFPALNDWVDFKGQFSTLDFSILASYMNGLPYRLEDGGMGGAVLWIKTQRFMDNENAITIQLTSNGDYTKKITLPDGTSINECSDDGINWTDC